MKIGIEKQNVPMCFIPFNVLKKNQSFILT